MSIPFKPLPYLVLQDRYPHYNQAKWLRSVLAPKIKRKLPPLYYGGWSHGTIPKFVQEHKKEFPYFFSGRHIEILSKYRTPHAFGRGAVGL